MQNPRFQYALLPELLVAGGYNKAQVKQVQIDRLRWVHLMVEGEDMNIPPDRNKIFQAIEENPVAYNPTVIETTARGERSFDIFSRLLRERIIFLGQGIDDVVASIIVAQLLLLEGEDPEKDIRLYINCPGGSITSGLAVYDTMMHIRSDVSTICMGQAAAMGAFILSSGAKGKRLALPHSRVLMRQPMGGAEGQASDIEIQAKEILRKKKLLVELFAKNTGQSQKQIEKDNDRDNIMTPEEAKEYGLIDEVIARELIVK